MPSAVEKLATITTASKSQEILPILTELATNPSEDAKAYIRKNLDNESESVAAPLNVAIAGVLGIVRGSAAHFGCIAIGGTRDYQVHPFLHQLRLAMIACQPLSGKLKENASKWQFYPEFHGTSVSLADRIARIALAHSEMTPSDSEFLPLYSLGGYFDAVAVKNGLPKPYATGTTCVMTARAVYQAAGANMIGDRAPTVNTPNGPDIDLSRPSIKSRSYLSSKTNRWVTETYSDPNVKRNVFDENDKNNVPQLGVGDVYFIQGDGDAKYLMRPGRLDLAPHVGIVATRAGMRFTTVDGGSDGGVKIAKRPNRELKFHDHAGWSFGDSTSFSKSQLDLMAAELAKYSSDSAVEQWIDTNPMGIVQRANLAAAKRNLATAANDKLKKIYESNYKGIIAAGRRLITIQAGEKVRGTVRTVQGWWKPSMYLEMDAVLPELVKARIG